MSEKLRYIGLSVIILACLPGCNGYPTPAPTNQPPMISPAGPVDQGDQDDQGGLIGELSMPAKQLYWQVNQARSLAGVRPLELKAQLCILARQHVASMIEHGELTHTSPAGLEIDGRLEAEGIGWTVCAENVGRFPASENLGKSIVQAWLAPGDDRENVLNELCLETGAAVVKDEKTGKWYACQIFLRRTLFWEK